MNWLGVVSKWAINLTVSSMFFAFIVWLYQVAQTDSSPSVPTLVLYLNSGGLLTICVVLWKMSKPLREINDFLLIFRMEHEWIAEHVSALTGEQRPAQLMAKAKKVGL